MLLEGLHIPLTTPFHRDGRLNTHALAANVLRYSLTPAAGLIVLGPSAEPTLLSDDETREALQTAACAAAPEKVLVAGIARDSVASVLSLAEYAATHRYDAILVGAPSVLAPAQSTELLTFARTIADRSPLPVILLSTAARPLTPEATADLAAHPNILGLITDDSAAVAAMVAQTAVLRRDVTVTHVFAAVTGRMRGSADPSLIAAASLTTAVAEPPAAPIRSRTKQVGFQVIAAHAATMLDALNDGAFGIAPPLAAAAPQACYEVFAAWKDQDQPLAAEKQSRLTSAARFIDQLGPGALKCAADLNGYAGGFPRLPHLAPNGAQRAELARRMKMLQN